MRDIAQLKKIVIFHLYYHELWENIKPYLLNLQEISPFDLFITTPFENKKLFEEIRQSLSSEINISFSILPNEGADLYPFCEVISSINLDKYDILYKIHTKRNVKQRRKINGINCGLHYWRECMLNDILGKKNIRSRLQDFLDDEKLGASGYYPYLIASQYFSNKNYVNDQYKFFDENLPLISCYKHYGGTIFMARAQLYKCLQNRFKEADFVNTGNERFSDFTYLCEGILGYCVAGQGYSYRKGNMAFYCILKLLSHRITYPLYRLFVDKVILGN